MDAANADGSLSSSLARYLLLRMALGLVLLGLALTTPALGLDWPLVEPLVLGVVGTVSFSLWLVSAVASVKFGARSWFIWSQLALDAVLAAVLTVLSTGPSSGLYVVYLVNILAAGALLPPTGALKVAWMDIGVLLSSTALGWMIGLPRGDGYYERVETLYELVVRVFGLVLLGLLVSRRAADLAQAREERSVLLDQIQTGVVVTDPAGRVLSANPPSRRFIGAAPGQMLAELIETRDERWEFGHRGADGVQRILLCSRSPTRWGDMYLFEDITRLREMEATIAREERLAAVGRLTAGLAHEIRNPLAGLSGATQILQSEQSHPMLDIVLREVRRINDLVEELLDQTRPQELSPILIDPQLIFDDVTLAFRSDPRYESRIDVQIEARDVVVAALDPGRFRQVLWNLLLNAAAAIPERGRIVIVSRRHQDTLEVEVSDTGGGMSPDVQARVFDPFFTTRAGGTGLGLATVDRIVRGHGGTIEVASAVGAGTTFRMRFPLAVEANRGR